MNQNDSILDFVSPDEYIRQIFKLAFDSHDDYMRANRFLDDFLYKFKQSFPPQLNEKYNMNLVVNLIELAHVILKKYIDENALEYAKIEMVIN